MSWKRREGDDHNFIDGRTHVHHIHLINEVTGGEHNLELLLNGLPCVHCKRHFDTAGEFDPKAIVESELQMLNDKHFALVSHAIKHNVPIRTGPLSMHKGKIVRMNK